MNTIPQKYKRTYNDSFNDCVIHFRSDAPQSTIDNLAFSGEWYVVKHILQDLGYTIIEYPSLN